MGQAAMRAIMKRFLTFLRYVWHIAMRSLEIVVVLYVFSHLGARLEFILVALLGLIYVTIRSLAIGQLHIWIEAQTAIEKDLTALLHLTGQDPEVLRERWRNQTETERKKLHVYGWMAITRVAMAAVSLICLWQLFIHL
jgi:hypothetical protein